MPDLPGLTPLNDLLVARLGPMGPLYAVLALGLVLILVALPVMLNRRPDPLSKLKEQQKGNSRPAAQERAALRAKQDDRLARFANFLEPKTEEEMGTARLKLMRAGYRGKGAVRVFHAAQFVLGMSLLVLGLLYALIQPDTLPPAKMVAYALLPGVLGYYAPLYWVRRRIEERQKQMQNGFPDALDMLLVCVEAGQSMDQSVVRVAKELHSAYPALAEELEIVAYEVKAGKDRNAVLRAFGERSGVPDIAAFVTVMVQSAQFGTSIAEALRVYSADMRDKRVMRAEELANKLPTKMTLGTMLFTVPPLLLILVGPSVYSIFVMLAKIGH